MEGSSAKDSAEPKCQAAPALAFLTGTGPGELAKSGDGGGPLGSGPHSRGKAATPSPLPAPLPTPPPLYSRCSLFTQTFAACSEAFQTLSPDPHLTL